MTSLGLPDDDDDMTIKRKRERYVCNERVVGKGTCEYVLVRRIRRHIVIGVPNPCPFNDISDDDQSMTMAAAPGSDCHRWPPLSAQHQRVWLANSTTADRP